MEKVKAVCDSGPLMALAKLGVLSKVFSVYPALGILVELYQKKLISKSQLKEYLEEIKKRKDIWINPRLCQKLIEALDAGFL